MKLPTEQPAAVVWRFPEEQIRKKLAAGPDPYWTFPRQLRQARDTSCIGITIKQRHTHVTEHT